MQEIWKDVKGYEGLYQVSNLGNVKSLNYKRTGKERNLKLSNDGHGYLRVALLKDGIQKTKRVHKLVAESFLNHKASGMVEVVDHINNNQKDNRLSNLRLTTNRDNVSKHTRKTYSKYTGVTWCKRSKRWLSRIRIEGKQKHLGSFKCEIKAHYAYQEALKEVTNKNK